MPPKIPITRARVLETALQLVNERGAAGFTMRALATELDIEAPSLYKHIASKDEILDGLCELVYNQISVGELNDRWQDRLRAYTRGFRNALLANRNVACILAVRPIATVGSMTMVEASLGEFTRAGVDAETGRRLLNIIVGYVVGHVLSEVSDPVPGTAEHDQLLAFRQSLEPEMFPLTLATVSRADADRDAEFELGLDLLIDGISIRYAADLAAAKEAVLPN